MYCPNCNTLLFRENIIKTNVKDAEVEYDARCPFCNDAIGHVFWGKLYVRDGLDAPAPILPVESEEDTPEPEENLPDNRFDEEPIFEIVEHSGEGDGDKYEEDHSHMRLEYYCPHCGRPLPDNREELPRKLVEDA